MAVHTAMVGAFFQKFRGPTRFLPSIPGLVFLLTSKDALRKRLRAVRAALDQAARLHASESAATHLLVNEKFSGARVVGLYGAFRSEADPQALEQKLKARGGIAAYPMVVGDDLVFRQAWHRDLRPVEPWGVPEPSAELPSVSLSEIDLLVVPGLGFTVAGHRLGYGRGFYDRVLIKARAESNALFSVGFAFACQVLEALPTEPHDQRLDALVTENGFLPRQE